MSIEGQGHFLTLFFPRFRIFCAYTNESQISGERLQDHWSSGWFLPEEKCLLELLTRVDKDQPAYFLYVIR